jgi:flavin-dependent dehydrogenase
MLQDPTVSRPCLGIKQVRANSMVVTDEFFRRPGGCGYVVDRVRLDRKLREAAIDAGANFVRGRLSAVKYSQQSFRSVIQTGSSTLSVRSSILVDATGRPAAVGRRLGAERIIHEALLAKRQNSLGEPSSTQSSPVWLRVEGKPERWSYQVVGPDGRLQHWEVAKRKRGWGGRDVVAASSACLSCAAGENWIAVGDAAACFDPISSQGLANAFSTALVAAGAILSPKGLDRHAAKLYASAVSLTFANSERGRSRVYAAWQ